MVRTLRQRLKPLYRNHCLPIVSATLAFILRLFIRAMRTLRLIKPAGPLEPASFLVVSLAGHLGDTVMLLPAIEALRAAHPHARIEVAVEASAAPFLQHIHLIDHVHAFRLGTSPPITFLLSFLRAATILRLWWPRRYDIRPTVVLVPRWGDDLFRSITLAYLTQAPRRIGFASDAIPGQKPALYRDALLTQRIHGGSGMHEPAKFMRLLAQSGLIPASPGLAEITGQAVPSLIRAAHHVNWTGLSTRLGLPDSPYIVIAPGATMPRRIYPVASWLPVIASLQARGFRTVLLSGSSDASIARTLHQMALTGTLLTAGATTIIESASLLAHASLFIGNDSGPGHLAGALGVPSIILFIAAPPGLGCDPDSPASPERVRPIGPRVVCILPAACVPPCRGSCTAPEAHCIAGIQPGTIIRAAEELLSASERRSTSA